MWKRLQKNHPVLYEAIEWGTLAMSGAAFGIALVMFLSNHGWC